MDDTRAFGAAFAVIGAGLLATWLLWPSLNTMRGIADGPGPNLVIDVEGRTFGQIEIDLFQDRAPRHVERLVTLARQGAYDGVVFHRVIPGFMAQTGDVQFGRRELQDLSQAGMGGSELPDLPAEFSDTRFERGVVGMARGALPDSANSQFFIMLEPAAHLDGTYTAVGRVIIGMDVVDAIKRGDPAANGVVQDPDYMVKVTVKR
jgi:peptidylprolyl isomerase